MQPTILSFSPSLFVAIAAGPTPTTPTAMNVQVDAQALGNTGSRSVIP